MFLEDFTPGERTIIGSHTFTADEIIAFARDYDPQFFHIDPEAAKQSHFGGLIASGWHTASIWMRLNVAWIDKQAADRGAAGTPIGRVGPSPGFTDMRWAKPVRPGDTLTYGIEIVGTRRSKSRPDWGVLSHRGFATDQLGDEVFSFLGTAFIESRPGR